MVQTDVEMAPKRYTCLKENCDWEKELEPDVGPIWLRDHLDTMHPVAQRAKPPPLSLPKLNSQISAELFQEFKLEWENWKSSSNVGDDKATGYLLQCCESSLRTEIQASVVNATAKREDELLGLLEKHAVINKAKSALIADLLNIKQAEDETVRKFKSRIDAVARNCGFEVKCTHACCNDKAKVPFADLVTKHVLINGLYDDEIRLQVLGVVDLDDKSLQDTVAIIEGKETALRSMSGRSTNSGSAAISSYGRQKKIAASDTRLQLTGPCETCGKSFKNRQLRTSKSKPDEIRILKLCTECWAEHRKTTGRKGARGQDGSAAGNGTPQKSSAVNDDTVMDDFLAMASEHAAGLDGAVPAMMWDSTRGWVQRSEGHGVIELTAFTTEADYRRFGIRHAHVKPTAVKAVADSGCQSPIMGLGLLYKLGLKKKDLVRINATATSISGTRIDIIGVVVLRVSGLDRKTGKMAESAAQVRVASNVRDFYISKQMMRDLGIIEKDFPSIHAASVSSAEEKMPCNCPRRAEPPALPETLPFEPKVENIGEMKSWIQDRYAASAFNKCPHVPLPMMNCEPIRIHVDPAAKPVAAHTASTVPIHLRQAVKQQLDEDVAMGTLERVPVGTKTTWQARMHVVTKPDGSPRRTVDLRALNDHCLRETEHIVPPYKQARLVPAGVWKTKSDAWNGYHSCPLDERDRHLTTFITEWGRFWYRAAPQGFMASGDGYNQRYGRLTEDMPRTTRCVDDLVLWDEDLETHWWRALRYIDRIARNGIIISPAKFEFCSKEVEFAGFKITETDVLPLPKYLDAVEKFPRPTNITDVRSFFGLICQLAHYAKLCEIVAPFKPFLSPKVRFKWTDELEDAFIKAKKEIVEAIREGVRIFEPGRRTVLSPDWSRTGIGYFLYQQHCNCPSTVTTCCENGWRVVLAGSRFLSPSERNYWPTEGEMLGVCWALEDTKFFTLGCTDLHVQTDHKPLVKLLGDKTLDEIQNRRLVKFKERTFPWKFGISWVAGKTIPAPDATSRHPQGHGGDDVVDAAAATLDAIRTRDHGTPDLAGDDEMAAGAGKRLKEFRAITWEIVKEETDADNDMQELMQHITSGFHCRLDELSQPVAKYWQHRESLYVLDGVIMLGDRAVVPPRLRKEVLQHLHGAHQGVTQMTARASSVVFWPGISTDIQRTRDECETCDRIAPSQRATHPVMPVVPTTPFEAVATDFFDLAGSHYLIVVDRLTNWVDVRKAKPKTDEAGTQGVMDLFREVFRNYGVPVEVSSDGGPEYTSREFDVFLRRWGVRHRLSAAYNAASNGRAEVAVKAVKRALRENCDADGNVDNDKVTRALLAMRNTPDRESGRSPAELLLGRPLRDTLPHLQPWSRKESPVHRGVGAQPIQTAWHDMWDEHEVALRHRLGKNVDKLEARAHDLPPLDLQAHVRVQNQHGTGAAARRWDRTGVVVGRNLAHDQYWVKMDGSRRVTVRNRKFLRQFKPATTGLEDEVERLTGPAVTQKQDQKQDRKQDEKQDQRPVQQQDSAGGDRQLHSPPGRVENIGTPGSPAFVTPMTSPATPPAALPMEGTPGGTPARSRVMAPRRVTFNLPQGETLPGPAVVDQPPPQAANQPPREADRPAEGRPSRTKRQPAWLRSGDFDTETSAVCNVDEHIGVEGMIGGDKDDLLSGRGNRQDPTLPLMKVERAASEEAWLLVGQAHVIIAAVKELAVHEDVTAQY